MKKVIITGANGFVGQQIMRALANSKSIILPFVRNGKESLVANLPNVEKVISTPDLFSHNVSWWKKHCRDADVIIHAAWFTEPNKYLNANENFDCLIGSLNLAKGAAEAGVSKFVGIGTCLEYELNNEHLSIKTPLKPTSIYAATKSSLYLSLTQLLPIYSVNLAWCRLFYLFGENENEHRLCGYIRKRIKEGKIANLSSGTQIRDYLDVAEAGNKITEVALNNFSGPINICSGIPITVKELAEKIAQEYDRKDLLRFGTRKVDFPDPPRIVGII